MDPRQNVLGHFRQRTDRQSARLFEAVEIEAFIIGNKAVSVPTWEMLARHSGLCGICAQSSLCNAPWFPTDMTQNRRVAFRRYPFADNGLPMIGEIFIKHLELFGRLSGEDKDALRAIDGEVREFKRGEDILLEGERPTQSVVVFSGLLQRYTISPEGKRQIHSFYLPTDTPCLETLHIGVMDNTLGALAASRIGLVAHPQLFKIMDSHPNVLALFWRETLIQAAMFREWLMRNSQMLAHAQMAHLFCEIMTRARAAGLVRDDTCDLPITQEDLADALGMTSVHVNRTLMVLRTGGLVEFRGGRLTVTDWDRLVEIAEFDPSYLHLVDAS